MIDSDGTAQDEYVKVSFVLHSFQLALPQLPSLPSGIHHVFIDEQVSHAQPLHRWKLQQELNQTEVPAKRGNNKPRNGASCSCSKSNIDLAWVVVFEVPDCVLATKYKSRARYSIDDTHTLLCATAKAPAMAAIDKPIRCHMGVGMCVLLSLCFHGSCRTSIHRLR